MIPQRHKLDWNSNRIPNLIDNATSSSYNNLVGSANTSTIVTTKLGTFSSTWKGSGTLYFDPGDGGDIEPLVLTTGGANWDHAYPSAGSKTIKITGDLGGVTYLSAANQSIISALGDIVLALPSLVTLIMYTNSLTGNISVLSGLFFIQSIHLSQNSLTGNVSFLSDLNSLVLLYINSNSLTGDLSFLSDLISIENLSVYNNTFTFSYVPFPAWDGSTYNLSSCVSTSQEVGDLIRAAANGGMNNCIYKLDGTNPAPPSTQEVLDGIATLAGNGVTLYVST
jgi:hypothetical protein